MSFKPSWQASLVLALLAGFFIWLGHWQWQRAAGKELLLREFAAAPVIGRLATPADARQFTRVTLEGAFDDRRHFLVDNRFFESRAGVHVLTPFTTRDGTALLVNRGWLPMAPDRRTLPRVPEPAGAGEISGTLDLLAVPGKKLGRSDRLDPGSWPQLVTYPDLDDMEAALGTVLYPLVLLLDADSPGGFADRDWRPVHVPPQRHRGYAFQWSALAAATVVAWLFLGFRRARAAREENPR